MLRLVIGLGFWWGIVIIAEVLANRKKPSSRILWSGNSALICVLFLRNTT